MYRAWVLASAFLGCSLASDARAQATEIYKCTDASGRPLYTSDKRDMAGKKCELVSRQVNVMPSQGSTQGATQSRGARGGEGASFPRESSDQRASAKDRQREILQKELATEQESLARARQELAQAESTRSGDERNYARVLERLQPLKDSVETHEKNIQALQRELGNLSR
jgi:chromosome segregation ATPase